MAADTLIGGDTLNVIEGGAGADILDCSFNEDTVSYASSAFRSQGYGDLRS